MFEVCLLNLIKVELILALSFSLKSGCMNIYFSKGDAMMLYFPICSYFEHK